MDFWAFFALASFLASFASGRKTGVVDDVNESIKELQRSILEEPGTDSSDKSSIPELLKSPDALKRLQQLQNLLNQPGRPNLNYKYDPFTQSGPVKAPYLRAPTASHSYSNLGGYGPTPSVHYDNPHETTNVLLNIFHDLRQIKDSSGNSDPYAEKDYKKELFDTIFKHLWHFNTQGDKRDFCPEQFDQVDDLCLIVDEEAKELEYEEARLACRAKFGGDLAVIRTPNEHRAIINYLWKKDSKGQNSFFLGCSEEDGEFTWLDGRRVLLEAPFFYDEPTKRVARQMSERDGGAQDSCVLDGDRFLFMDIKSVRASQNFLPLCQYIHGRDETNFHYSHQIYSTNFDKKYNKWFFPEPNYDIKIKHRIPEHELPQPPPYGYQPYGFPHGYAPTSNTGYNQWADEKGRQ